MPTRHVTIAPETLIDMIAGHLDAHHAAHPDVRFTSLDDLARPGGPEPRLPVRTLALLEIALDTLRVWAARMDEVERYDDVCADLDAILGVCREIEGRRAVAGPGGGGPAR